MKHNQSVAIVLSVVLLWCLSQTSTPTWSVAEIVYGRIHQLATTQDRSVLSTIQYAELTSSYTDARYQSITFLGDIMLARHVELLMQREGSDFPYRNISWSNDEEVAVIGNFESAAALEHVMTKPYHMRFSTNPLHIPTMRDYGITHVSLANNHSLDYGIAGFYNAIRLLAEAGVATAGCSKKLDCERVHYLNVDGRRVAIVALYGLESGVESVAETALRTAANYSDMQIVYVHWGNEYELTHSPVQEREARTFIAAGADLIVGHHPHVVQDIQLIDGVPVIYSLGNFIFDQHFSNDVKTGLVVQLSFADQPSLKLLPVDGMTLGQPKFVEGDKKAVILYQLSQRSDKTLEQYIKQGQIPLALSVATSIKTAMIKE